MDPSLRERILSLVKPLYQDLDGVSRMTEADRVAAIARRLYQPPDAAAARHFELLLLFQGLGKWLEKPRNLSRAALTVDGLTEEELQRVGASVRRLDQPVSEPERAIAAARIVDRAGIYGLAERFAQARREGLTIADMAREEEAPPPAGLPEEALLWIERRRRAREEFRRALLRELTLEDP